MPSHQLTSTQIAEIQIDPSCNKLLTISVLRKPEQLAPLFRYASYSFQSKKKEDRRFKSPANPTSPSPSSSSSSISTQTLDATFEKHGTGVNTESKSARNWRQGAQSQRQHNQMLAQLGVNTIGRHQKSFTKKSVTKKSRHQKSVTEKSRHQEIPSPKIHHQENLVTKKSRHQKESRHQETLSPKIPSPGNPVTKNPSLFIAVQPSQQPRWTSSSSSFSH